MSWADHNSPCPETNSMMRSEASLVIQTPLNTSLIALKSEATTSLRVELLSIGSCSAAMVSRCRLSRAASFCMYESSCVDARFTDWMRAFVTPLIAETTTATRSGDGRERTISLAARYRSASARLVPPNLWTVHSVLGNDMHCLKSLLCHKEAQKAQNKQNLF